MNQFLSTVPFDLYELALFQLIVKHRSFTKAAEIAGLTQSALTRQMQGVESSLGIQLLERTTRTVRVTAAGEFLNGEATRLLGDVEHSLKHLSEEYAGARKEIRVDVSRTIGLAYLPGFFHANLRRSPQIAYRVACESSNEIVTALEANEQDVGVLCPPRRLPKTLRVTHRFQDTFTLIAPVGLESQITLLAKGKLRIEWLKKQNWLLIEERSNTGQQLQAWMRRQGWRVEPTMQLDNFDLIINLVALGMGIGFVPIRALALYNQKQKILRIPLKARFTRELVVVVRKHRKMPEHVNQFIVNVLF
ncbi:MAG TPA: LysR family transcriptional regulator [Verrucomicrobiae bacterium]|jgi:DNA-binding transcriptional LysR family regulator